MKSANQILHEEGAKGKHFGLLSGTVPTIERAMEVLAKQRCIFLIKKLSDNDIGFTVDAKLDDYEAEQVYLEVFDFLIKKTPK